VEVLIEFCCILVEFVWCWVPFRQKLLFKLFSWYKFQEFYNKTFDELLAEFEYFTISKLCLYKKNTFVFCNYFLFGFFIFLFLLNQQSPTESGSGHPHLLEINLNVSCEELWTMNWPCSSFFVELDHTEEVDISWERWSKKKHHMMHVNWPKKIISKCNSHPLCRTVGPNTAQLHSQTTCLMVCKALGLHVLVLFASLSFWWRNNCNSYQSLKWLMDNG
jgi:hypothetical protein